MSDGEKLVHDLGTGLAAKKEQHVVRLDEIRTWLAQIKSSDPRYGIAGGTFLETAETIARTLKVCGLKICKKGFSDHGLRFQVVANFEVDEKEEWKTLKDKYLMTPQEAYELTHPEF